MMADTVDSATGFGKQGQAHGFASGTNAKRVSACHGRLMMVS